MLFFSMVKEYFVNTSFHGLRFIAQKGRHWTERLFWLGFVMLSWYGSAVTIDDLWHNFQENPINFGVETTYLNWDTDFPSITVCEMENVEHYEAVLEQYFPQMLEADITDALYEIINYKGSAYNCEMSCKEPDNECPKDDLRKFVEMFRFNCTRMFHSCFWNNQEFECCKYFQTLETEIGPCYSINNLNLRNNNTFDMKSNRSRGVGELKLRLRPEVTRVYPQSRVDVPVVTLQSYQYITAIKGYVTIARIQVNEIHNEPDVEELDIDKRRCRFPDENYLTVYDIYSPTGCVVNCRRERMLEFCNCTSHYMPKSAPEQMCDINGIICLEPYLDALTVPRPPWSTAPKKEGLQCDCLDSCINTEVEFVLWPETPSAEVNIEEDENGEKDVFGEAVISLDHLPSERFIRTIVRGKLDLVVSMGGAAGLFVGASLLSFVEIIYYFTVRFLATFFYGSHKEEDDDDDEQDVQRENSTLKERDVVANVLLNGVSYPREYEGNTWKKWEHTHNMYSA